MFPDFPRDGQCPHTNWETLLTVLHQESSHHIHSKSDSGRNKPEALLLYFKIVDPNGLSQSWQTDLYILGDEIVMILFSYITFSRGTFLSCVSNSTASFHPAGDQQNNFQL